MGYLIMTVCFVVGLYLSITGNEGSNKSKENLDVEGVEKNTLRSVVGFILLIVGPFVGLWLNGEI